MGECVIDAHSSVVVFLFLDLELFFVEDLLVEFLAAILEGLELLSQFLNVFFWLDCFIFFLQSFDLPINLLNLDIILALHRSNPNPHHLYISFKFLNRSILIYLIFDRFLSLFFIFLFLGLHAD